MNAFHVRDAGAEARIGQSPILSGGFGLQIRRQVSKWIGARIVVVVIAPHKSAHIQHRRLIQQPGPGRSDVERLDLRPLVGRSDKVAIRIESAVIDRHSIPSRRILRVE